MTPARRRRLVLLTLILVASSGAIALILFALNQNINLFYTPTQIMQGEAPKGVNMRVGGLVVEKSVVRDAQTLLVRFDLTDQQSVIRVQFNGILPDLFREGQGIIALGQLNQSNVFEASEVLAKHDENYMPPEVADALKQSGARHPANIPKHD